MTRIRSRSRIVPRELVGSEGLGTQRGGTSISSDTVVSQRGSEGIGTHRSQRGRTWSERSPHPNHRRVRQRISSSIQGISSEVHSIFDQLAEDIAILGRRVSSHSLGETLRRIRQMYLSATNGQADVPPIDLSHEDDEEESLQEPLEVSSESSDHTLSSSDDDLDIEPVELEESSSDSSDVIVRGQPEVFVLMKQHNGRVKCSGCQGRITSDQVRLDYRPGCRSAPVRHSHIRCAVNNQSLYFPSRGEQLIAFHDGFSDHERSEILETLRTSLRPESQVTSRFHRLYSVVRHGDTLEIEEARRRMMADRAAMYLETRREIFMDRPLFTSHFVAPVNRGLPRSLLEALPQVNVTPTETEDEEHTCVICLEALKPGQHVTMLPCFHRYHSPCIAQWLENSRLCPIDKLDIGSLLHSQSSHR